MYLENLIYSYNIIHVNDIYEHYFDSIIPHLHTHSNTYVYKSTSASATASHRQLPHLFSISTIKNQ